MNKACALPLLLVFVSFVMGCSHRPKGVLSDKKTTELLTDLYLAEAYISQNSSLYPTDSTKKELRQSIFAKHGIKQSDFDATLDWYGKHFDDYVALYDDVEKNLRQRKTKYFKDQERLASKGEIKTLWTAPGVIRLTDKMSRDGVYFEVDPSAVKPGERLILKLRVVNPEANIQTFMAVEYPDGYTYSANRDIAYPGMVECELLTDSARKPTRLFGYIRPKSVSTTDALIDSISLTVSRFDKLKYKALSSQTIFNPKIKGNLDGLSNKNKSGSGDSYNASSEMMDVGPMRPMTYPRNSTGMNPGRAN